MKIFGKTEKQILKMLESDKHYYGEFGKQFLSYSDTKSLLGDLRNFKKPTVTSVPLLAGSYFHISLLEPHKLKGIKVIECKSRQSKMYKEETNGEPHLIRPEVDHLDFLCKSVKENTQLDKVIYKENTEFEAPAIGQIQGEWFKGKADILNHDRKMIIDLKTSADINQFNKLAYKWNYDAQAYVYTNLFPGYEFVFVAIDKKDGYLARFDASPRMIESGRQKVEQAVENYRNWIVNGEVDPKGLLIQKEI